VRGRAVEERGEQQEGQVQRREKTRGQQRTREKVGMREESRSEKRWSSPPSFPLLVPSLLALSEYRGDECI
jgi:hypothetical protein